MPHFTRILGRCTFALSVALAGSAVAAAWEGRLLDDERRGVSGARVTELGRTGGVVTGADGRFVLPGAVPRPGAVVVELAGGRVVVLDLPPEPVEGEIELVLEAALVVEIDSVAPASTRLSGPQAARSRTFARDEIDTSGRSTVGQIVSRLPGATQESPDPDVVPSLRGLSRGRTVALLDGGTVATERRAGFSSGVFHRASVGRIDVLRGPASLVYGSAAIGGVLLVESPWSGAGEPRRIDLELESSVGDAPASSGALSWSENGFDVGFAVRRARDPTSARGIDLDGEFRQSSAFAGKSWVGGRSLFRVGLRRDALEDADRLATAAEPSGTRLPEEALLRLAFEIDTPGPVDRSIVGWLGQGRRQIERVESSGEGLGSTTDVSEVGARAVWRGEGARGSWLAGGEARHRFDVATRLEELGTGGALAPGEESPLDGGRQSSAALFGSYGRALGAIFGIEAGGRLEPVWTSAEAMGDPRSEEAWASAANVAITADAGEWGRIVLQLASGFREPTISERYYRGVTGRGFVLDNPDVEAESSRHLDLVWHRETSRLQLEGAAFLIRIDDVVVRELVSAGGGPGGADLFRFVNAGEAEIRGLELAASGALGGGHAFTAAAHALRGEDGEGRPLEGVPAHGVTIGWRFRRAQGRAYRLDVEMRDDDDRAAAGEQVTPGFVRVDAGASFAVGPVATLDVSLANVLDQAYLSGARSSDPEAPGLTARVALRLSFGG